MGIGPNNLGPDGKAGYTSCGHPKKSPFKKMDDGGMYKLDSGMYKTVESLDGEGQTPFPKSGFNIAAIEAKQAGKESFNYGGKEFPVK